MALEKKYRCLGQCKESFALNEWECFPGQPHEVESKTYYLADAPFMSKADKEKDPDGIILRTSRTQVHVIPEQKMKDETGTLIVRAFQPIIFVMGRYETTNPMEQYYLERSKIPVSYEKWFEAYHTPTQKANLAKGQLIEKERDLDRRERELNDLLAKAKDNVKSGRPASA